MALDVLRYAAFTDHGRGGNPAGVVLDAGPTDAATMLAVAAEVGYSETAFLLPPDPGTAADERRIRYFAPSTEVDFCGHATIATAVAVADREGPGELRLRTNAGLVVVRTTTTPDGTTATLVAPPTSTRAVDERVLGRALQALRWEPADLDPAYPVLIADAGNDHLVLAAATLERLAVLDYDFDELGDVMRTEGWTTVHAFWTESDDLFHARNPFPTGGVVEDPATGSAAAAFGGYLRAIGRLPVSGRLTILQGRHMGRPSRLVVDVDETDVRVTGAASPIAQ